MHMIRIAEISARAQEKSARFLFDVRLLETGEFRIVGKDYKGRVESIRDNLFVGCTCDATASCYHMPHYVARYERAKLFQGIETIAAIIEGADVRSAVPVGDVHLERAFDAVRRIGRIAEFDDLDINDTAVVGRLAFEASMAIQRARGIYGTDQVFGRAA